MPLTAVALGLLVGAWWLPAGEVVTGPGSRPSAEKIAPVSNPVPERRLREGAELIDAMGYFKPTGDRLTFISSDGKTSLVGLENLNLERIARAIADNAEPLDWKVTGRVTEYGGANYLLVERAIIRTRGAPPAR